MIVNSKQSLDDAIIQMENDFHKYKWLSIKVSKGSRTSRQNQWIYKAYSMLEKQGDMTAAEYRRYCKYNFGLAIVFEKDLEMASIYRKMLRKLDYESQMLAMDMITVTSNFDVEQGARYINEIINHFNDKRLPEKQL